MLILFDHDADQESNAFSGSGSETDAELFAFKLDPGATTVSITQLVFALSDIAALTNGDWGGIEIIVDANDDGDIDGESTKVGGDGVVDMSAGTITFSTSFEVSSSTNYILRADFSALTGCDAVTISLGMENIATTVCAAGTTTSVTHAESGVVQGLVGHWKLDDESGGTAEDSAGSHDGTITGATWTDGRLCGALDFDGAGDYVDVGDVLDFIDSEDFTITGWFSRDTFANHHVIVGKRNSISSGQGFIVYVEKIGDDLIFEAGDGSDEFSMTSSTTFTSSGWNHFAVVFDESSAVNSKIYINGTDDNESQSGTIGDVGSLANALAFRIGSEADGGSEFDGRIDDIRVYDRALSQADVEALAATYKVIDLGTAGEERSLAYSINDSEQIAGYDEDSATGNTDAWLCQTCSFTSLGTLAGGSVAEGLGVNSAGEVVGWSDNAAGDRNALFYDGSLTDLGTLTDRSDSEAVAINANSEVVGTAYNSGTPPTDRLAFIYLPAPAYTLGAGINSLGTLGGYHSVAMDINDSGQVVGAAENASEYMRPFRWQNGTMTDLGTLGGEIGFITHRANAINSSGDVVGMSYTAGGDGHAFLYDGSMNDLGVLTGGDTSVAYDINDDDQIVGTSNVTGGAFHAFIYQDSTMTDLNDLIDTNSTWTLIRATGINDDGEIVGWGENPDGNYHAFLLIQTCSGSGPPGGVAGAGVLLGTVVGLTDANGEFQGEIFSADGQPLAEVLLVDAGPSKHVAVSVTTPAPDSAGAPGPGVGTLAGFYDGVVFPRTLTVDSSEPSGSLKLIVAMSVSGAELADHSIDPEDVQLHVLDSCCGSKPDTWMPAGVSIGRSEPTGIVGDSGFVVYTDDSVDFWAVRDAPGIFAVGAALEHDEPGNEIQEEDLMPTPGTLPGMCGLGMVPCSLAGVTALIVTKRRRRLHAA
jgi:probable HAF family extracellular repeat protein